MDAGYPLSDNVLDRKSSPLSYDRSSPPVLVFSPAYSMPQPNYYGYPSSTPGSYGYSHPVTPFSRMDNLTPYYATPAPIGGQPMPLTATPTLQRPYTAPGPNTAAPSVLFRQPHSLYGSPSSSISSALPVEKDLAHTPPPLDLSRRSSQVDPMGYYMPDPALFPPHLPMPDYSIKSALPIKKRSRTAQACEKCRIRKAKCSGGQPCTRCINKKLPCVFSATTRSRGAARWKNQMAAQEQARRRHSLDDPFATPTAAQPMREARRHSEGSVEPRLIDESHGALGLELNAAELSRPNSAMQNWAPAPYYVEPMSAFPWTPDYEAYPQQTFAEWQGQE